MERMKDHADSRLPIPGFAHTGAQSTDHIAVISNEPDLGPRDMLLTLDTPAALDCLLPRTASTLKRWRQTPCMNAF